MAIITVTPSKVMDKIHYFQVNNRINRHQEPEIILLHPDGCRKLYDLMFQRNHNDLGGYDPTSGKHSFKGIKIIRSYDVDVNTIEVY
jgi:hypothetical protein